VAGNIAYDNTAMTVLDNINVYAKDYMRNIIDTTQTDVLGHFEFTGLPYGKYLFDIEPANSWAV